MMLLVLMLEVAGLMLQGVDLEGGWTFMEVSFQVLSLEEIK